ncbi:MAG TPA: SRPBCC family protein [Gemmatimonadales bacterium]|nr:SRPBCC family protein [Gemmatimonadales bacterium]
MSGSASPGAELVGREITLTRTFDAPRSLVFKAWTEPEHLARWWGPQGFSNPVCEVDARVGGAVRIHMQGPDGGIYPMRGVFQELAAPERIVLLTGVDAPDGTVRFEVLTTVTLVESGGRTTLTLRARVVTAVADAAMNIAGMEPGWSQSLDRLQALVAPGQPIPARELVTERVIAAPRELVFRAWTEPEQVAVWWGPNGFTNTIHEMDVRPGGMWRLTMHGPDGRDYLNENVYLQVVPPALLVYYHQTTPKFVAVATFEDAPGGTKVTMRGNFLSSEDFDTALNVVGAREGAKQTLGRLADHVARIGR